MSPGCGAHSRSALTLRSTSHAAVRINPILRGWVQDFAFGHSSRCFSCIRDWVAKKIRYHLARASQRHGFGWKRWSREWPYGTLGLFHAYYVAVLTAPSPLFPLDWAS